MSSNKPTYKLDASKTVSTQPPSSNGGLQMTRIEPTSPANREGASKSEEDPAIALIEQGKREQDHIMDQISQGLDVLKQGAEAMGTELEVQDKTLEDTQRQTDNTKQEVKETAHHNAFRRHLHGF